MRYFKQEDFDKCKEFLEGKPDTVETQQELHKFMHDKCREFLESKPDTVETQQELHKFIHKECRMLPVLSPITVKDFTVYTNVYKTATICPNTANWCATMSNGSQVVWNRKYQEFYMINEVGTDHCRRLNYLDMFPELKDMDAWLLENWIYYWFQETQKQLIAIWNGKYNEYFKNYWRQ